MSHEFVHIYGYVRVHQTTYKRACAYRYFDALRILPYTIGAPADFIIVNALLLGVVSGCAEIFGTTGVTGAVVKSMGFVVG